MQEQLRRVLCGNKKSINHLSVSTAYMVSALEYEASVLCSIHSPDALREWAVDMILPGRHCGLGRCLIEEYIEGATHVNLVTSIMLQGRFVRSNTSM